MKWMKAPTPLKVVPKPSECASQLLGYERANESPFLGLGANSGMQPLFHNVLLLHSPEENSPNASSRLPAPLLPLGIPYSAVQGNLCNSEAGHESTMCPACSVLKPDA